MMDNSVNDIGLRKGGGEPLKPKQWYQSDTYYQILYLEPSGQEKKRDPQNITTNILARQRGTGTTKNAKPDSFDDFELDRETIEKLKDYPRQGDDNKLSSYLPSPGVVFPKGFINSLSKKNEQTELDNFQTELGNFYNTMRILLHSRKLSQLIAKTWWSYLQATKKDPTLWDKFTAGEWDDIDSDILDGLIAREIFLFAGGDPPDNPDDPKNPHIYIPLKGTKPTTERARFLIFPSSKSWQGISLSLLLAGQAYYKIGDKYHQISQSILSTGEIVFQYSLEVDWTKFSGDIKELLLSHEKPFVAYQVVIPYPPIPSDIDQNNVEKWAYAKEEGGDFPFYKKKNNDYLMDVEYFSSPYPYIPLSCT